MNVFCVVYNSPLISVLPTIKAVCSTFNLPSIVTLLLNEASPVCFEFPSTCKLRNGLVVPIPTDPDTMDIVCLDPDVTVLF